jgi:hypothetical protein
MRPRRHVQFPYPGIPQTFTQKLFRLLVEQGGEQGAIPQGVLSPASGISLRDFADWRQGFLRSSSE